MDQKAVEEVMKHCRAPSIILMGEPGAGKTHSLATLARKGLVVCVIVTEPTGLETLIDTWIKEKLPPESLAYHVINPAREDLNALISTANKIAMSDQAGLSALKASTASKQDSKWFALLKAIADFPDDRTGAKLGPVKDFDAKGFVFVIDSLSGMNVMALDMACGDKPIPSPADWGIAMKQIDKLIQYLTSSLQCMFVLTGHMEPEVDENTGARKVMLSTLGKKLAPVIPRMFSEVIMAYRENDKFFWATSSHGVVLKNRALPISSKLPPTFEPIVEQHKNRLAFLNPTKTEPTKAA